MDDRTFIKIASLVISEPITVLTNILIAALCLLLYFRLLALNNKLRSTTYWQYYFVFMGLSAAIGIIKHGMVYYQSEESNHITWSVMNLVTGLSIFFAQLATIEAFVVNNRYKLILTTTIVMQLLLYFFILSLVDGYGVVKWEITAGLLPIMIINAYNFFKGSNGNGWLAGGILTGAFAAAAHGLKISACRWFNYNDIAHVFIMLSLWMMFYGIAGMDKNKSVKLN